MPSKVPVIAALSTRRALAGGAILDLMISLEAPTLKPRERNAVVFLLAGSLECRSARMFPDSLWEVVPSAPAGVVRVRLERLDAGELRDAREAVMETLKELGGFIVQHATSWET